MSVHNHVDSRSSGDDDSDQSRSRLRVCRRPLCTDWSTQPHYAAARQQLRLRRAEARHHRWRQGLHSQGVEKSLQLPED